MYADEREQSRVTTAVERLCKAKKALDHYQETLDKDTAKLTTAREEASVCEIEVQVRT
jgi:hypothetical protein